MNYKKNVIASNFLFVFFILIFAFIRKEKLDENYAILVAYPILNNIVIFLLKKNRTVLSSLFLFLNLMAFIYSIFGGLLGFIFLVPLSGLNIMVVIGIVFFVIIPFLNFRYFLIFRKTPTVEVNFKS